MKRLITICAVVGLMLSAASVSWATPVVPTVTPPSTGDPSWWNQEGIWYAYGYWSTDIQSGGEDISPPADSSHWASNYLDNTDFTASIGITNQTILIELGNEFHRDLQKQIYVYITGTANSTTQPVNTDLQTDGGVFYGDQTWNIDQNNQWSYLLDGVIIPQPAYVNLSFTVPGMTSVTNIWAGENCVPEPATIALLGLGGLLLGRNRKFNKKTKLITAR